MGGVIFITTVSLFHFLKNSYHSEKLSVFLKNFFRKWECISSCYLPISPNVLRKSFRKASLFLIFELLPAALFKCVWTFVTTQHELVNIVLCFYCKSNEKVGEVGISYVFSFFSLRHQVDAIFNKKKEKTVRNNCNVAVN